MEEADRSVGYQIPQTVGQLNFIFFKGCRQILESQRLPFIRQQSQQALLQKLFFDNRPKIPIIFRGMALLAAIGLFRFYQWVSALALSA